MGRFAPKAARCRLPTARCPAIPQQTAGGSGETGLCLFNTIVACNYSREGSDINGDPTQSLCSVVGLDPGFAVAPVFDESGKLANAGTMDLHLREGGGGVDAGSNALAVYPDGSPIEFDLDGNPRIVNGIVDVGAYEYQGAPVPVQLDTPEISKVASNGQNRHTVAFGPVANAASYTVAYSIDQETWNCVAVVNASIVVSGLAYGDLVCYRVRAMGDGEACADSEWSEVKSLRVCPMSITGGPMISPSDFAALSSNWMKRSSDPEFDPRCDINGSGMVDASDFLLLSQNWMKRTSSGSLVYPGCPASAAEAAFADPAADFAPLGIDPGVEF